MTVAGDMTVPRRDAVDGVLVGGRGWRAFALPLLALLLLALLPRLYSAATLGWHWDHPGSFTLVNFDEGGSCRAALDGFEYTPFIGYQTIAIASALGSPPPADIRGRPAAVKAYCHGVAHLQVARLYSAVTGALTAPLLAWLGLMLWPGDHRVGWTAGLLTALSGFHISESHSGTVDAPSVFFIYLLLACLVAAAVYRRRALLWAGALLLVPALWAKYWLFALFALLPLLPRVCRDGLVRGWSPARGVLGMVALALVFACLANSDFRQAGYYPLLLLFYLVVPWRALGWPMRIAWLLAPACAWLLLQLPPVAAYTMGGMTGNFGGGYAAIGWHKFLRNLVNIPVVLLVGLGLPAFLCLWPGLRALWRQRQRLHAWQYLLPLALFLLYMALLAPVTYYRHYLVLIPGAALLAAVGYWSLPAANKPLWLALFLLWPAALALDLNLDYHRDPRIARLVRGAPAAACARQLLRQPAGRAGRAASPVQARVRGRRRGGAAQCAVSRPQ